MSLTYPLAAIINFCSNDYPFLSHCIESVKPFCSQIIVPVCDHFFDGIQEDRQILNQIYAEHPDVQFIEFPFDKDKSFYGAHSSVYWHNLARLIGRFFTKEQIRYILFLDCDEMVDSERFIEWLQGFAYQNEAIDFSTYWYFRSSCYQAKTWEHTPLFMRKESATGSLIMNENERAGMYDRCTGKKASHVLGSDGLPMFHHYSWVRTKPQLIRKVCSWSHHWQRDWMQLVEEEFSHEFQGTDFVHGYEFLEVAPKISIDLYKKPATTHKQDLSHVRRLKHADLLKIDVALTYQISLESASLNQPK